MGWRTQHPDLGSVGSTQQTQTHTQLKHQRKLETLCIERDFFFYYIFSFFGFCVAKKWCFPFDATLPFSIDRAFNANEDDKLTMGADEIMLHLIVWYCITTNVLLSHILLYQLWRRWIWMCVVLYYIGHGRKEEVGEKELNWMYAK